MSAFDMSRFSSTMLSDRLRRTSLK